MTDFSPWLKEQLAKHGYIQVDFARKIGVSRATINGVLSKRRGPGIELLNKIAIGLMLPLDEVYRAAGIIPLKNNDKAEILANRILALSPENQEIIESFIDTMLAREEKKSSTPGEKKTVDI